MKSYKHIWLKIFWVVFILAILFFIIALFWYQDYSSIKTFLEDFLIFKNLLLIILLFIFSVIIWFFSCLIINKIFTNIENNNKKLQEYNHYLAHELKTPISVVQSNLDVLKYWFDKDKISSSKLELKNMVNIINWLLNFSETIQITDKKDINIENFIKKHLYFIQWSDNIIIENNEFNFSIYTDELLFERVVKNLIENALKYSLDERVKIKIFSDKIIFENNIHITLEHEDLEKISTKFYSGSYNDSQWNWIWLSMIQEILNTLWYTLNIKSENNKFIAEIILNK